MTPPRGLQLLYRRSAFPPNPGRSAGRRTRSWSLATARWSQRRGRLLAPEQPGRAPARRSRLQQQPRARLDSRAMAERPGELPRSGTLADGGFA